jgi:hypothetical protein
VINAVPEPGVLSLTVLALALAAAIGARRVRAAPTGSDAPRPR